MPSSKRQSSSSGSSTPSTVSLPKGFSLAELATAVETLSKDELLSLGLQMSALERSLGDRPPQTDDELHAWIKRELGIDIPRVAVCHDHCAPFDFFADAYFERSQNILVMANRGGSKTFLVALLHFLNSRFKPGCESASVGAIEMQARRAYAHLQKLIAIRPEYEAEVDNSIMSETRWKNGARVEVLGGTIAAVNGPHPQKVHFDEVELADPEVFYESLTLDTPVLTPSGYVKMGDLNLGDRVIGGDGKPTVVTKVMDLGTKPVFELELIDGRKIRACGDHRWTTATPYQKSLGTWSVRTTSQIEELMRLTKGRVFLPPSPVVEFDEIGDLPLDPYLLGVLLGDGCVRGGVITLAASDQDIVGRVRESLPQTCRLSGKGPHYAIRGSTVRDALGSLGLLGRTSFDKFVPEFYLRAPSEARLQLLQGLMDTDGSTPNPASSSTGFAVRSRALMRGVAELVRSLGGRAITNAYYQRNGWSEGMMFSAGVTTPVNPYSCSRKASAWRAPQRTLMPTIRSVIPAGEAEVRCISVSSELEQFVAGDYIVTMNSRNMAQSANGIKAQDIITSTRKRGHGMMQRLLDEIDDAVANGHKPPHDKRVWCVPADTPIDMPRDHSRFPDGVPIAMVKPGSLVWSYNEEQGLFQLKRVKAVMMTKENAAVYRVTLDSGKIVRATADHPVLTRDGRWVKAGDLRPGDSLMPLYRDHEPYVRIRPGSHRGGSVVREYLAVADALWSERPRGHHVHHRDGWHLNSDPDNLALLSASEHHRLEWEGRRGLALGDNEKRRETVKSYWTSLPDDKRAEIGGRISEALKERYRQGPPKLKIKACVACGEDYVPNSANQKWCVECRKVHARNHTVVSIEFECFEDVWDMEVEDNHNFVVHGVVLHNCIFETAQNVPNCRKAAENEGRPDEELCDCNRVVKGRWDDGRPRVFSDICQGRLYRSDGWIEQDDVHKLFMADSQEVWEAQLECVKPSTQGLVLPRWTPERFGIRKWHLDSANGPIFCGIDFGGTNPHCALWAQLTRYELEATSVHGQKIRIPEGAYVVFAEFYRAEVGNMRLANEMKAIEQHYSIRPVYRFPDPQGKAARLDLLAEGIKTSFFTTREVKEHVKVLTEMVDEDRLWVVTDKCPMLVQEIAAWHFPKKRAALTDDPDVPVNDFDHAMAALRYLTANAEYLDRRGRANSRRGGGAPAATPGTRPPVKATATRYAGSGGPRPWREAIRP